MVLVMFSFGPLVLVCFLLGVGPLVLVMFLLVSNAYHFSSLTKFLDILLSSMPHVLFTILNMVVIHASSSAYYD